MPDPVDMIVPLMREIRSESAASHEQTRERIETLEGRLEAIEGAQNLTTDSLLSKLVTGEFGERIDALEGEVRELENQK